MDRVEIDRKGDVIVTSQVTAAGQGSTDYDWVVLILYIHKLGVI